MQKILPTVFVYADNTDNLVDLLALGRQWGESVQLLFTGDAAQVNALTNLGIDVIHHYLPQPDVTIEDFAPSFAHTIQSVASKALILMPPTKRCKALSARLGARLHAGVINEALQLQAENDTLYVTHQLYGGLAHARVCLHSAYAVVTPLASACMADTPPSSTNTVVKQAEFIAPARPITLISRKAKASSVVDLGKAKHVVGVGRGFAKQEDLALAQALATAIGAEVACSRPIAEGEGWMEHERYVGVSGVTLTADVYVAVGISGQIQHMVGVNGVKTIVAINKDKNAPIFGAADYGLVGDIYKVLPALTKKMAG